MRAYMRSTYDPAGGMRGGRVALPLPEGGHVNVRRRRGAGHSLLRALQPLARLAVALLVDGTDHIVRSRAHRTQQPVEGRCPAEGGAAQSADVDLVDTKGADLSWCRFRSRSHSRWRTPGRATGRGTTSTTSSSPDEAEPADQGGDGKTPPDRTCSTNQGESDATLRRANSVQREPETFRRMDRDVAELRGPSVLRTLSFTVPRQSAVNFSKVRLRVTWDWRGDLRWTRRSRCFTAPAPCTTGTSGPSWSTPSPWKSNTRRGSRSSS